MAGFCFWLVVSIFIVFSVRKGRKSSNRSEPPPVHPQRPERKSASPHRSYSSQSHAEKQHRHPLERRDSGSEKSSSVAKTTGNERKNKEARKQREADLQAVFR